MIKTLFRWTGVLEVIDAPPLDKQIEEYAEWRKHTYPVAAVNEVRWVEAFFEHSGLVRVCDVRVDHVRAFHEYVKQQFNTQHAEQSSMRAVGNFLGYYHARGYTCPGRSAWREGRKGV